MVGRSFFAGVSRPKGEGIKAVSRRARREDLICFASAGRDLLSPRGESKQRRGQKENPFEWVFLPTPSFPERPRGSAPRRRGAGARAHAR